jgi:acetoacetyl-CoA synthetase
MSDPVRSSDSDFSSTPLWEPSARQDSVLDDFSRFITARTGQDYADYAALHAWSVGNVEEFWNALWDFAQIRGEKGGVVVQPINHAPWARFFPEGRVSYAENMLRHVEDRSDLPAIIARTQGDADRVLTWRTLYEQVSVWEQALAASGVGEGDKVGVYLPNIPETVVILLAVSNLGAVFCSAGMEMGPDDLISRLGQAQPKVFVTADGYVHGAKTIDRTAVVLRAHAEIASIEKTVILPVLEGGADDVRYINTVPVPRFLAGFTPQKIDFKRRDFNHPLYILFSSGTTGKPKCFEHSSGGALLKHMSEYLLHCDVRAGDRVFYHATPSWMMWNWLASGLAAGATILMYDGSPAYPDAYAQWDFTVGNGCTHHGTAAPLILSWRDGGLRPAEKYDLSGLRMVLYTGAVLPAQGFAYIHSAVKHDVKIAPLSGGTDIVGSFVAGNPWMPTYAGQINGPILGMDVRVWDEGGNELAEGQAGELVCVKPFPSMPLRFLDDPEAQRYQAEYFDAYAGKTVWRHGDSIEKTAQGQLRIIGRSDATLNQNGVRIGAVAIYNQLEAFKDQIREAAAVDFTRPDNSQAITVLFLAINGQCNENIYKNGDVVPVDLQEKIRKAVKDNITPYAIPTEIIAVPDVLKTPNGKKAEVVMKKIINGTMVPNPSLYGEELVAFYERIGAMLKDKYAAR